MSDTARLSQITTRAASYHTFCIIRRLVDHGRSDDAYRAYAYFRWVDDLLDAEARDRSERLSIVTRQRHLIEACYAGDLPSQVERQEAILVDLIRGNPDPHGPLATYIQNMMAVMAFDAERRDRLISEAELRAYQHYLAVAVTEAMHFFIGRCELAPHVPERYLAVTAAHITHMLRDTREDLAAGYFNIPAEVLQAAGISPFDVESAAYRQWVRMRVEQARSYFGAGRRYLKQVRNGRCRLAAYAYTARFEAVLDVIERDGFLLRGSYCAASLVNCMLRVAGSMLASSLGLDELVPARGSAATDR